LTEERREESGLQRAARCREPGRRLPIVAAETLEPDVNADIERDLVSLGLVDTSTRPVKRCSAVAKGAGIRRIMIRPRQRLPGVYCERADGPRAAT
jgi:hypothetical protein